MPPSSPTRDPVPASGGNRIGLLAHPRGDELRQRGSTLVPDTAQADFADYAAARWTTLVRAARRLGCPLHDAQDLVQTAHARAFVSCRKVEQAHPPVAYLPPMLPNTPTASRPPQWWRASQTA